MQEFLTTIFGTFLGAALGIPAGFILNHFWTKFVDRERRRQLQLLSAFKTACDHNIYLIDQIEEWLKQNGCPYFNVDLPLLESTASLKYELFDADLCREIDRLRYELSQLARKVDLLLELEFSPTARLATTIPGGSAYNALRPHLVKAIQEVLPPIRDTLEQLKGRLAEK